MSGVTDFHQTKELIRLHKIFIKHRDQMEKYAKLISKELEKQGSGIGLIMEETHLVDFEMFPKWHREQIEKSIKFGDDKTL